MHLLCIALMYYHFVFFSFKGNTAFKTFFLAYDALIAFYERSFALLF